MVSVSGFRGRVGDPLTPELIASLAAAFGTFLRREGAGRTVYLGRDSRTSGAMYLDAAAAGLRSVGVSGVDLGIVPTPTLLLSAREAGAAGALGITASHNPAEWNALKFGGGDGTFLDGPTMGRFLDQVRNEHPDRAAWDNLGSLDTDDGALSRHLDRILSLPHIDVEGIRERGFRVAVDCVHGAGGIAVPPLLEALGCTVMGMGMEADGRFPRDPEPTAANLSGLGALVRESRAEVGFAVDPDVDRLSLVDGRGEPVGEDLTLALCAAAVLRRTPGPVVTNLSTSEVVADVCRHAGVPFHRAPVGEINVSRKMTAVDAVVGGEGNGGVILPALHGTRDALVGMALILQHLLETGHTLREAVAEWPSYRIVKEKVPVPDTGLDEGYRSLEEALGAPETDRSDGLRLGWPGEGRWLHVRPSGTEPVVRFIAEGPDEAAARALIQRGRQALGV